MAIFLPLYCGHRNGPCLRRPVVHLGSLTRTYHGPEGDPILYDPTQCPLGFCSKQSPKKKKKKSPKPSPKASPKVSPIASPKVSPKTSPGHTLPVPTVSLAAEDAREKPLVPSPERTKDVVTLSPSPSHRELSSILVTTPTKEEGDSPRISPTSESDDALWSHELILHNIKLSNLKVTLVEGNRVYIQEHQDLSMGNEDEMYESYTRRQMVLVPEHVEAGTLSAYLYHSGVLLLTAKRIKNEKIP